MKNQCAFTLVELSIVLVILGLLIGGVLTGQSLIRAAELRAISTQHQRYIAAVHTFRDKYFAIPGDMTNAQSYWGIAHATPATCATTASTDTKTCNGDGNGKIDNITGSSEIFRFWQHLTNAGLIEGSYSGIVQGSNYGTTAANAPSGRINSSYWFVRDQGTPSNANGRFNGTYDNSFVLGGMSPNEHPYVAILKPEELYNIDMKTDDGLPAQGKIVSYTFGIGFGSCTTGASATALNAEYLLSVSAIGCAIIYRQQF